MKLKPGDIIAIEGADCLLDQNNIDAIEVWKKVFESGDSDEEEVFIGFYTVDGETKGFPPSKVLEVLERQDFNKSRYGI
jgi:hypothetical protein